MKRMRMLSASLLLSVLVGAMPAGAVPALAETPSVLVAQDAHLGTILTGPNGMTLYRFTKDAPGVSNCYDQCAVNWPPLLLKAGEQPAAPAGLQGTLGTTNRKDGALQVTYNGSPLYFWAKDKAAGDTTGQNVNGVWFVQNPDGASVKLVQDAKLGPILTGANGMTLYVFTKDLPGQSNCYDQCAVNWPPLLLTAGEQLNAPAGLGGKLGTATRKDGSLQVTLNGAPLYFWLKDKAAGDTTGQRVNGVWFAAEAGLLLDTAGAWSQSAVASAVRSGWAKADASGSFAPNRQVTQAEFAAMVAAAFKTPAGQASPADPNGAITRVEAVTMLIRALGLEGQATGGAASLARFTDAGQLSDQSAALVALAVDKGILQGYQDNTIRGDKAATRAEAVTLILRALKLKQ